jgi:hypothetical protein
MPISGANDPGRTWRAWEIRTFQRQDQDLHDATG